ncbi:3-keto-L-gulonate-6-phosphate decarboxylase UlaD [Erwinia tracheiphila]|uniref:3-dehydro-L-gulonate-6-phosphate decarboxylase n=1 Tax=Erwinia tracheiphila TaxID=65700 RepID=A0A0M2KG37_9GAMM|nr:3-keto-L-gulonate-6-phosphate decarboxylase UlaD [Erwinia tracheiphila]AXF77036.1 3-keto-L-gulonate-6-phosphate decarboxylase UlaD [Erwinia tracheiphila]EOS93882.1 3-keto-L-gulonate-6-phosphate decarboxylase [Erwinia tracheiphila PSU-1]KKF35911.1 3-keto-L-gulonate-6-phosphate decarboxylase [Erwinia tracheiphila]UIA84279.1 3-keto-L-gulonate-6-phosphate decarboxylase UlaD [Erwinia tracheiphila]UIA87230.1 3-keto-L-gulonate-6-phosphate decarboxylase UlaD [Erwinia tracheiphila]
MSHHARPQLQLALDHTRLDAALEAANHLHEHVDIVEAGTILCFGSGVEAVRQLRQRLPEKTLVADFKVADAGSTLAELAFEAGASWMTVICAAPLATFASAHEVAQRYQGEIQIELFGHWTMEDARNWRALGLKQAIYHRGRDAQAQGQRWSQQDLDAMKALSDLGFGLSVTGGITPQELPQFKEIDVRAFIVGRALTESADGLRTAAEFHQAIDRIWGI